MKKSHEGNHEQREYWDLMTEASMEQGPAEKATREEMAIAIKAIEPTKAADHLKYAQRWYPVSGKVGIGVMMELCQHVLDGKGMPDEWRTSVLVPIFKRNDVRNCNIYREMKLLQHALNIVERVQERRIQELVNNDAMHFGFMSGRKNDRRIVCCEKNARGI